MFLQTTNARCHPGVPLVLDIVVSSWMLSQTVLSLAECSPRQHWVKLKTGTDSAQSSLSQTVLSQVERSFEQCWVHCPLSRTVLIQLNAIPNSAKISKKVSRTVPGQLNAVLDSAESYWDSAEFSIVNLFSKNDRVKDNLVF